MNRVEIGCRRNAQVLRRRNPVFAAHVTELAERFRSEYLPTARHLAEAGGSDGRLSMLEVRAMRAILEHWPDQPMANRLTAMIVCAELAGRSFPPTEGVLRLDQ